MYLFAQVFEYLTYKTIGIILCVYAAAILVILYRVLQFIGSGKSRRGLFTKQSLDQLTDPYFSLAFMLRTFRRSIAMYFVVFFYLNIKMIIPLINPANYDLLLWDLDRVLHFGFQPNLYLLQAFANNHDLSIAVDWLYLRYFKIISLMSIAFLLELRGPQQCDRFVAAHILVWTLGSLLYLIFPADGPCYRAFLDYLVPVEQHLNHFTEIISFPITKQTLDAFIHAKFFGAKSLQQALWTSRYILLAQGNFPLTVFGIAAMPSLHVAVIWMISCFALKLSRLLAFIFIPYLLIVCFGAVFLQWHYALDVYLGLILGHCSYVFSRLFADSSFKS